MAIGKINFDSLPESHGWVLLEDGTNENPMVFMTLLDGANYVTEQGYYSTGSFDYGDGLAYTFTHNDDRVACQLLPLDKSHYESLPGIVCAQLDGLIPHHEVFTNFYKAWNEYAMHVMVTKMDDMKMPGYVFNKYKINQEEK